MNNRTRKILLIVLIAVLAILAVFIVIRNSSKYNVPNEQVTSNINGCYVATLGKDVYTLVLRTEDNKNVTGMIAYNNYQKDSSSGSFVGTFDGNLLIGNYSFDSEGMHSDRELVFKRQGDNLVEGFGPTTVVNGKESLDLSRINYDSNTTFVKNGNCVKNFTDTNQTYSFDYNPYFHVFDPNITETLEWRNGSTDKGQLLGSLSIPRTFLPNTNFSDARLTVGRSASPNAIKNCTVSSNGEVDSGATTIAGYPFKKYQLTDAAAGNLYETTSYRGIFDGDCYAIEYIIHSTNIANYPSESGIKQFDKGAIVNSLESIIKSFRFLISSN